MKNLLIDMLRTQGIDLEDWKVENEIIFATEMLRWNKKINLTAITDSTEVVEKHLLDSLVLYKELIRGYKILDIGTGAGIPCIPLAIALPEMCFWSIESVGKKVNFQKHIKRKLNLENLQICPDRVEKYKDNSEFYKKFDVIVSRAFSSLESILALSGTMLKKPGKIIAMKGPEGIKEYEAIDKESISHFEDVTCKRYFLPKSKAERYLITFHT